MSGPRVLDGEPYPQGVSYVLQSDAYNFALYSKHAERVALLLYGADDAAHPLLRFELDHRVNKTGRIWHIAVGARALAEVRYYAYAVDGPEPAGRLSWHAFDPEKVLLDPYARAVWFPPGFDRRAACASGPNAGQAPLGVLRAALAPVEWPSEPDSSHDTDAVIYELHVRGFTRHESSGLAPEHRGTFRGLIDRIPYLRDLGVTVVELMPVFQFDPQQGDVWGYMPLSFFAPHDAYTGAVAPAYRLDEFRALVSALHAADLEVVLDVVYNHTTEGDVHGPTYSFRGIDNSTYYRMSADPERPYDDFSGTGNTMHTANRYVRKLILDSLRYWATETRVDGFRFDLASVFARRDDGTLASEDAGIFGDVASDPALARLRLIAEPWDAAGTLLGPSLPGITWAQWNGRFRDDVRRFVRGDGGLVGDVARRIYGSPDIFPDDRMHACQPRQSINYVTCHDGFTLYDLVSYTKRRNWANGLGNEDGPAEEYSWNCGWEGEDGVPDDVRALRLRQVKNFAALVLLSAGTPMIRAGDEFLQTQGGNSNPYNQDNETTWLDWRRLQRNPGVFRFFKLMIAFRRAHPSLGRRHFWRDDVHWYGCDGALDTGPDSRALAFQLDGRSCDDDDIYVMVNADDDTHRFIVPEWSAGGSPWLRVVDTAAASPDDIRTDGSPVQLESGRIRVADRSVVVLRRPR